MRSSIAMLSLLVIAMSGCGGRGPTSPMAATRGGSLAARENLKPLPKPTATPSPKGTNTGTGYGYSTPAYGMPTTTTPTDTGGFVDQVRTLGYVPDNTGAFNVLGQVATFVRMPATRFVWASDLAVEPTFQRRKAAFPAGMTFDQWKADGLAIARLDAGVSYYVGKRGFYKDVLADRQREQATDLPLIMYKRKAGTTLFVSYRADGRLDDYGIFPGDDWRELLPVPSTYAN